MLRFAALLLLGGCAHAKDYLQERRFDELKDDPAESLVLFYRASNPEAKDVMEVMNKVAEELEAELPFFQFQKCDGDLVHNAAEFDDAAFSSGSYLFTSTPEDGIVKYTGKVSKVHLAAHIRFKYAEFTEGDVKTVSDEDDLWELIDTAGKPVLVKYYEEWCKFCKKMARGYKVAASAYKNRAVFVEVECGANEETTALCNRQSVTTFPTVYLYTGEDKTKMETDTLNFATYEEFFFENEGGGKKGKKKSKQKAAVVDAPAAAVGEEKQAKKKTKKKKSATKIPFTMPSAAAAAAVPPVPVPPVAPAGAEGGAGGTCSSSCDAELKLMRKELAELKKTVATLQENIVALAMAQ